MDKKLLIGGIIAAVAVILFKEPMDQATQALIDSPSFTRWDDLLKKYAAQYKVPWRWLKVLILNESSNGQNSKVRRGLENPNDVEGSKSSDGKSWGLMQITLPTAKALEGREVTPAELNNPDTSVRLAAKLMRQLIDRYGFVFEKVMRDYNGGPKANQTGTSNYVLTIPYYTKSLANLAIVTAKHPGNELETT